MRFVTRSCVEVIGRLRRHRERRVISSLRLVRLARHRSHDVHRPRHRGRLVRAPWLGAAGEGRKRRRSAFSRRAQSAAARQLSCVVARPRQHASWAAEECSVRVARGGRLALVVECRWPYCSKGRLRVENRQSQELPLDLCGFLWSSALESRCCCAHCCSSLFLGGMGDRCELDQ